MKTGIHGGYLNLQALEARDQDRVFYRGISGKELELMLTSGRDFSPGSEKSATEYGVDRITWFLSDLESAISSAISEERLLKVAKIRGLDFNELRQSGSLVYSASLELEKVGRFYNIEEDRTEFVYLDSVNLEQITELRIVATSKKISTLD